MSSGPPRHAAIGLGANAGDCYAAIDGAVCRLDRIEHSRVTAVSERFWTEPVGPSDQHPFLNAAALLETTLRPRALLEACQAIERDFGRDRRQERRWGPRPLDLDILLMGDLIIDEPDLRIPHPRLAERLFALTPLAQIAPDLRHPELGVTVECLRAEVAATAASE